MNGCLCIKMCIGLEVYYKITQYLQLSSPILINNHILRTNADPYIGPEQQTKTMNNECRLVPFIDAIFNR